MADAGKWVRREPQEMARRVRSIRIWQAATHHPGEIMRVAMLIASVLLASTAWPQNSELIPEAYLAPKYLAPPDAPSHAVIAGRDERGDRLIVTGRALDQGRPVAGVSVYAFHADGD